VYNPASGTVTWNVGNLSTGAARTVSFQLTLVPSLSQVGTVPQLLGTPTLSGTDTFTGASVRFSGPAATTQLSDPGAAYGNATVQN
jgi:hypothetical protein